MKISHEVPICLLNDSLKFNDYDYCLPLFYELYPLYRKFYKSLNEKNRFIILDNGLFEGKVYKDSELLTFINEIQPNIFIIPDSWNDDGICKEHAVNWIKKKLNPKVKLMGVIQCTDLKIGSDLYKFYQDIGIDHIAFNHSSSAYKKFFPHQNELISKMMGRIYFINYLLDKGIINQKGYHHLLGCSNYAEFQYYGKGYEFIKSVDTSNPVIFGLNGVIYKEQGMSNKPHQQIAEYMNKPVSEIQRETIICNINLFKQMCNG